MPPRVCFIIPVLNEQGTIARLLQALRRRYPHSQLLVVDGGSTDATVAEAMPLCNQLLLSASGRALQMNLGGNVAGADYLLFLHADSAPGVTADVLSAVLADEPEWGFCTVRLCGERLGFRVIERFINWRSRLTKVATGDQMLFVRRDVFAHTGGFDEIPLMEDVAYSKRLRRLAAPVIIDAPVMTSSRRWEDNGMVKTVLQMWLLRFAYFVGVSPRRLWQHYYGRKAAGVE
tara:strand:- start:76781 stop:77476 length:696 start_codon:yes stop_codon:yes gene_type:complete